MKQKSITTIRKGQNEKIRERKGKKGFGTSFQNEPAREGRIHKLWARDGTYERETGKRGEQCQKYDWIGITKTKGLTK